MQLFICHASDDKADFVQPLAEALNREYEVWYDKFVLTLGDSLLRKIDEGLASCDFGVVVLSHAFFSKKWPQSELDGLFVRETASRKIILPIWKGVTREEVERFSPILAGRLAVLASDGLEAVVGEIKRAVQLSERTRELSALQSAMAKAKKRGQTVKEMREGALLLNSEAGVRLIESQFSSLFVTLRRELSEIEKESELLRFKVVQRGIHLFFVRGPFRIEICLAIKDIYANSARTALLRAVIYRAPDGFAEERDREELGDFDFKPLFRPSKQLVWVAEKDGQVYLTDELAASLIDSLTEEIEKHAYDE